MITAFLSFRHDHIILAHRIRRRVIRDNNTVCKSQVAADEEIEDQPDRICRAARPVEMVLVRDENNGTPVDPGGEHSTIHRVAHDTVKTVPGDEPADAYG